MFDIQCEQKVSDQWKNKIVLLHILIKIQNI